jgi:hypothetical protein
MQIWRYSELMHGCKTLRDDGFADVSSEVIDVRCRPGGQMRTSFRCPMVL